jgi:hypothetical protein
LERIKHIYTDKRAKELHDLIENERTKRQTTIVVGNTEEVITIIGTTEEYLRNEIKEALNANEIQAKSTKGNYAEENVMEEADEKNLTITEIDASRPICIDCEIKIRKKNIVAKIEFSGKKSKNRKFE